MLNKRLGLVPCKNLIVMIKSIENTEHYKWGNDCDGWHLLKTDSLSVIQEKMPLGTSEQLHFHSRSQQLFYILSGVATFEIDKQSYTVNSGESIHIPAETVHCIANNGVVELEFLVISEPKAHGDRTEI